MSTSGSQAASPLKKPMKVTLGTHISNVFRLVIKEVRSIRPDPTMLILVAYASSFSVNTVASGAVTEATNLSIGIVDEDSSQLSRQIAEAFVPPTFPPAVKIRGTEIDPEMDQGRLILVVEIPPNFEADVRAQRKTYVQVNVDGRRCLRPAMSAATPRIAVADGIQKFVSGQGRKRLGDHFSHWREVQSEPQDVLVFRDDAGHQPDNDVDRDPDRRRADPRARAGHGRASARHAVVPAEIMLAKMFANGLVILVAAMLSLRFVVQWWLAVPIAGSPLLFVFGAALYALVVAALGILLGTLSTTMGQFGLLAMPVLMVTQLFPAAARRWKACPSGCNM